VRSHSETTPEFMTMDAKSSGVVGVPWRGLYNAPFADVFDALSRRWLAVTDTIW
jgi:hypothetical protein